VKHLRIGLTACILLVCSSLAAEPARTALPRSDAVSIRKDLDGIKRDLAAIRKELGELRQLLTQRPAQPAQAAPAAPSRVSAGDGPDLGKRDAPVTVVEFSDYQCPFCARHFAQTFRAIKSEYIDTGKVRYVFRDFPLESIHPQARKAAEAAHCAGAQGKYWEMHDMLFRNQGALMTDNLKDFARTLGLDTDAFNACLDQDKHAETVARHLAAGCAAGVTGTPGFSIGKTSKDDTLNASFIKGA
jgi:protein-disulfide isomerase